MPVAIAGPRTVAVHNHACRLPARACMHAQHSCSPLPTDHHHHNQYVVLPGEPAGGRNASRDARTQHGCGAESAAEDSEKMTAQYPEAVDCSGDATAQATAHACADGLESGAPEWQLELSTAQRGSLCQVCTATAGCMQLVRIWSCTASSGGRAPSGENTTSTRQRLGRHRRLKAIYVSPYVHLSLIHI